MAKAGHLLRIGAAAIAAGLGAAPAVAATPAPGELARWVAGNTDLPIARIAIAGPEQVYSLEQLGPRTSTGEVIALVRSEALAADPLAGPQSWEAHLLFDCSGGRLRQIRSVTWPERNRKGRPTQQPPREGWIVPQAEQPAMQLLSAACDPTFAWPLQAATMTAALPPAVRPPATQPEYLPDIRPARAQLASAAAAAAPAPPPPSSAPAGVYGVQVARGPSKEGAARALLAARRKLEPLPEGVTERTDLSHVGSKPRYTAVLAGFASEADADAACEKLATAGQACFTVRR
jgi:hypothetical protein